MGKELRALAADILKTIEEEDFYYNSFRNGGFRQNIKAIDFLRRKEDENRNHF